MRKLVIDAKSRTHYVREMSPEEERELRETNNRRAPQMEARERERARKNAEQQAIPELAALLIKKGIITLEDLSEGTRKLFE